MGIEVGKETPQKEMDFDVFLWRHTWHLPALRLKYLKYIEIIVTNAPFPTPDIILKNFEISPKF